MTENEKLYNQFKKMVKNSPYLCKNLPVANRNVRCDVCGEMYDYRYTPMVTNETWTLFGSNVEYRCAHCMEQANNGKLKIVQLTPCLMSTNYMFCNDLSIDNDKETKERLIQMIDFVEYIINKYDKNDSNSQKARLGA